MADTNNKLSGVLTQAQVDAQAIYAAAANVNPYKAELIKKNANGNIMAPGVLESLTALGVDVQSGVGKSIANIDAATREARLADQKAIAQQREKDDFNNSGKGQLWSAVKGFVRGGMTIFGTTYSWMNAQYRQGSTALVQSAQNFGISASGKSLGVESAPVSQKYIPGAFEQTVSGQVILKSLEDFKKGKFIPDINTGEGFFPSSSVGQGELARQASLGAAKIAIKNSKGKIIGYQPRTILGDTYSNIFTLGHPESEAGAVISTVADITGSFMFDTGLARAADIKRLRKLAQQDRVKGAMDVAARREAEAQKLEDAMNVAMEAQTAARKQADLIQTFKIDEVSRTAKEARDAWTGKSQEAIKASTSVRVAQARLDEMTSFKAKTQEEIASTKAALDELSAKAKAPKTIANTESALAKQESLLQKMKEETSQAVANGLRPMHTDEDFIKMQDAIAASKAKLEAAKNLVAGADIPAQEAIDAAKAAYAAAKRRLKEVNEAIPASVKQVAERERIARSVAKAREIAANDTLRKLKSQKKFSERLDDAKFQLDVKRAEQTNAIKEIANIADSIERPGLDYQAIADFLTGGHGTIAVDRLAAMTDWKEIWRKSGGKLNYEIAQALADAKNPDDIVDIIAPYLKRGDIQEGVLTPGRLSRMGEKITQRTAFALPAARVLRGVGARVQSRMGEHEKIAALFEGVVGGVKAPITITKPIAKRGYQTKIKAGSLVNIHDREELLRAADDFGRAANLSQDTLDNIITEIANAESNSVAGYAASVKLMNAVFEQQAAKVPAYLKDDFKRYTTAFQDSAEQMSSYWAREHINGAELRYINLKGESVVLPGPHMQSELLNSTVYFPPVSELLKLTSRLAKYQTLNKGKELADVAINGFWKKTQLVRPAYIIRNIAEEQIRVFGTGHISFFNNPGMALAMWLGRPEGSTLRRMLNQFDTYRNTVFDESFSTGDEALDVLNETTGHAMKNSYIDMMNLDRGGAYDDKAMKVLQFKNVGAVQYGHKRFFDGVANQVRMLNSDEMARIVAGFNPPQVKTAIANGAFREDAVIDYFLTGAGRKTLNSFAEATPDKFAAFIKTPDGLKSYLFTGKSADTGKDISMRARVSEATGGNATLMKLIANGSADVAGKTINIPRVVDSAINSVSNSKQMRAGKKQLLDLQEEFARELKFTFGKAGNWEGVLMNVPSRNLAHVEGVADKRNFVEWFFDKATEFEKNSTFGPEFRQAYWDAINQIAKALDADAKARLLKAAEGSLTTLQKAGKPIGSKHPVWNAFNAAKGDGPLTLDEAHAYADTYARNSVKGLFYNASEKRLIFHQLRLIAPFANAWEDTIRRWSEIGIENPMQVYKGVKTLEWLQKPESSALYQLTDAQDYYDPNQGFFFNDPGTNQRQFFVPFAGTVMAKLAGAATGTNYAGAPMTFTANPASFNFALGAGTILPGVGPGVTIPISLLGDDFVNSLPMGVQKWLFPFGRPDFSSGLQSAILPANWNRILGGFGAGGEAAYASNVKPVMNYLASGGDYNLDDPDDQARLIKDTNTFSRWQSGMRGLVGMISPMGLIQQGLAKDENGDVTLQTALFNDFEELRKQNDGDYNKTWYDFLNLYGPSQAFALISASAGSGPSNWDSYQFVVQNPDIASKYSDVWGYVYPGGGLSTEMYRWNLVHDTKKRLSAKEILEKVNNQRYYATRDALMTKVDSGEMDKTQYSGALQFLKDSMGGGPVSEFDPNKRNRIVSQLKNLVDDQRFVDIPSIVGLRNYMAMRDSALATLGKTKFTGAAAEQPMRDWLAAQAEWVVEDYPDFQKMFYAFFANELEGK